MQGYKMTAKTPGAKAFFLLLATSFLLQTPYAALAEDATNSANVNLTRDKLPDLPQEEQAEEIDWLHAVNNLSKESEAGKVEEEPKLSSTAGREAATTMPPPVAAAPVDLNKAAQTPNEESSNEVIAAAGDGQIGGRIVADPNEAPSVIEDLTRQILLKVIALEKFNLNYKLNVGKQDRWKGWRYAAFNEVNGALGLTGGIISVYNRGIHAHRSKEVKTYVQEDANWIPMIGCIIGASAAAIEFGINEFHDYQAYKKGFSPGKAKEHVNSLKNDINRLIAEREALVKIEQSAPLLTGRVEIDNLEGKVLEDLRDQSLLEYQRFHLSARRLLAFQQMQYFFDFASNVTNAIGYDFAYLSLHRHRRVWNGRAGTLFDVSGALTMFGPITSRVFAKGVSEFHRHYTRNTIREAELKECAILERDEKALDAACKNGKFSMDVVSKVVDRTAHYEEQNKNFQNELQAASKELNRAKLVATQNVGAGLYKGASKVASGILFQAAGYPRRYNGTTQTAGRVTNHLLLAASIVGVPATSFAMLDTLRIQVQGERNRMKLSKDGKLPGQLIKARLTQLDAMEAKLGGAAK